MVFTKEEEKLRDEFATMCMHAWISNSSIVNKKEGLSDIDEQAEGFYLMANAMIRARVKSERQYKNYRE